MAPESEEEIIQRHEELAQRPERKGVQGGKAMAGREREGTRG